ncbi:hypothetical protein E4U24_006722 [Claviceps purpurea]|nr:hypothetical protein E4U37_002122 [Claviceps purpurea]KAG6252944.1 hypothetical protein E4U23_008236 [Claviceps purpurea]KAG6259273.1 hypothetical protein E4U24_006722 [Claviceps purpurea]KAG6310390.1 hypothetical protein E4U44_005579 [Claviceps purpurea]
MLEEKSQFPSEETGQRPRLYFLKPVEAETSTIHSGPFKPSRATASPDQVQLRVPSEYMDPARCELLQGTAFPAATF